MIHFARLYDTLDTSASTTASVDALVDYFQKASQSDSAWTIAFLIGRTPRQVISSRLLREWAAEEAAIPIWLFEESYQAVGDLAETVALLLPPPESRNLVDRPLSGWLENHLQVMAKMPEDQKKQALMQAWRSMTVAERFIWNKLLTGELRMKVSQKIVTQALNRLTGLDPSILAHRLLGEWVPTPFFFERLTHLESRETDLKQVYPFHSADILEDPVETLASPSNWSAEWKWDGIRSQLIHRNHQIHLWSNGDELITERFPEFQAVSEFLPEGTVIDGEILPWDFKSDQPMAFAELQKRIERKTITKKLLAEIPVLIMAYDLLEFQDIDIRHLPLIDRRAKLDSILQYQKGSRPIRFSQRLNFNSWADLGSLQSACRSQMAQGLMLKQIHSPYQVGGIRKAWRKWKVPPMTIDCVMTMAQPGSIGGQQATVYSDYTLAVWDKPGGSLVTVAKACTGLTDAEIKKIDAFVKKNTTERFGPVRAVKPVIVMRIEFDSIQHSPRHKSGIAIRSPRIIRICDDKLPEQAGTLSLLQQLPGIHSQNTILHQNQTSID